VEEQCLAYAKLLDAVSQEEEVLLKALCEAAVKELSGRLKQGLTPRDCGSAFPVAAAWIALSGLHVSRESDGVDAWTAGAVTVKHGQSGQGARSLREQAERLMGPYLRDEAFWFHGVKG